MKPKTLSEAVGNMLKKYEKARNYDATLIAHMIEEYCGEFVRRDADGSKVIKLKDIQHIYKKVNFYDSVRCRQIFQSSKDKQGNEKEPQYLPTDEKIREARRIKEKTWRQYIQSLKPVQEPLTYKD